MQINGINRFRGFEKVSYAPANTKLPTRKTSGSACYDFYMPEDVTIQPHKASEMISLGIKAYMQSGEVLQIFVRSSIGIKKKLVLANGTGIIDSDYYNCPENEGNIGIELVNLSDDVQVIKAGERVCQGMFTTCLLADNDDCSETRQGGFGSTGWK